MEFNVELPGTVIERRRLQNRIAQRRFRQKRDQQRHAATIGDGVHTGIDALPTPDASTSAVRIDTHPQSQSSTDVIIGDNVIPTPTLLSTGGRGSNTHHTSLSSLEDVDFWNLDVVNDLLANETIAPTFDNTPPSPSPFPPELNRSTLGAAQVPLVDATARVSLPNSHDVGRPQEPQPSGLVRKPLQFRRSAQMSEPLERQLDMDNDGWIGSLHIAARSGHDRMVDILLDQGEDCDDRDSDGRTPLMHAVMKGHESVARLLLGRGARIAAVDRDARSALHWAMLYRREAVIRMLLERRHGNDEADRLDVDAYDDAGWTPLHMAIYQNFEPGVYMLLQAGATLSSKAQKCPFTKKLDTLSSS